MSNLHFLPGTRVKVLHQNTGEVETTGTIMGGVAQSREHALIQYDAFAGIGGVHSVRREHLAPVAEAFVKGKPVALAPLPVRRPHLSEV